MQLEGADRRGMGVGFRLLAPPAHGANPDLTLTLTLTSTLTRTRTLGDLFQCVPPPPPSPPPLPPGGGGFGGWWSRRQLQWFRDSPPADASPPSPPPAASRPPAAPAPPPCCVLPRCLRAPLEAGDAVGDAAGRLVYLGAPDYFNCGEVGGHRSCAQAEAEAEAAAAAAVQPRLSSTRAQFYTAFGTELHLARMGLPNGTALPRDAQARPTPCLPPPALLSPSLAT